MARALVKTHNRGEYQRVSQLITSPTNVGTTDIWTSVNTSQLTIPEKGVWSVKFKVALRIEADTGSGGFNRPEADLALYNTTDAIRYADSIAYNDITIAETGRTDDWITMTVSGEAEIDINSSKTIELQLKGANHTNVAVLTNSVSGNFADPDNASVVWAVKEADN